jgi:hypothetical protein
MEFDCDLAAKVRQRNYDGNEFIASSAALSYLVSAEVMVTGPWPQISSTTGSSFAPS